MAYDKDKRKLYTTTDSSGKKIGISLWEIYDCLRYNKVDQRGNRNLGMVIKNGNINMWAKYKPFVKLNQANRHKPATEAERAEKNYGLSIPSATSTIILKNTYYNQEGDTETLNGWKRVVPRGEATYKEPFRALDFDGYNHLAPCPFTRIALPESAINRWETSGFKIAIPASDNGAVTDSIRKVEIADIKNAYFTVQIRHQNPTGTGVFIRTISAEKTVSESEGGFIDFSTYQLPTGKWDVIPFLSPIRFTTENDGSNVPATYKYIPIPKCYVGEMSIADVEYILTYFDGYKPVYVSSNPVYSFAYNFAVKNNTSSARTFSDAILKVRFPNKKFNDTIVTGEAVVNLQPFTIQAGETLSYSDVINAGSQKVTWATVNIGQSLYENSTGLVAYLQLGSGQDIHQLFIRQDSNTAPPVFDPDTDYPPIEPISE